MPSIIIYKVLIKWKYVWRVYAYIVKWKLLTWSLELYLRTEQDHASQRFLILRQQQLAALAYKDLGHEELQ